MAYDTDIEAMEAALAEAFPRMYEEHRDLYAGQPQYLGIEELGTSGMTVKLAVPTAEENFFPAKRQLTRLRVFAGAEHIHQAQKPEVYVEGGNN